MLTKREYLLTCFAEECNEVAQRCTKALRFGLDEIQPGMELRNDERIMAEVADLFGVLELLTDGGVLSYPLELVPFVQAKRAKVEFYLKYAQSIGTVEK